MCGKTFLFSLLTTKLLNERGTISTKQARRDVFKSSGGGPITSSWHELLVGKLCGELVSEFIANLLANSSSKLLVVIFYQEILGKLLIFFIRVVLNSKKNWLFNYYTFSPPSKLKLWIGLWLIPASLVPKKYCKQPKSEMNKIHKSFNNGLKY